MSGPDRGESAVGVPAARAELLPLLVAVLSVAGVTAWLVLHDGPSVGTGYLGGPVAMAAAAFSCHLLSSTSTVPQPVRRFWRRFAYSAACIGIGSTVSAVLGNNDPGMSPAVAVPMLGGVAFTLLGFAQLPLGSRSPLRWGQLGLDGATVAVAGGLLFYYMTLKLAPAGTGGVTKAAAAVVGVGGLLLAVVIGKTAMTAVGPIDGTALRLLTGAPLVGVAGSVLLIVGADGSRLAMSVLAVPLVAVSMCAGAAQQARVLRRPAGERGTTAGRSLYSLVPFLAVCATTVLLVTMSARQMESDERTVVIGAVLIASFVVLRQLLGLRETERLVRSIRGQQAQLEYHAHHDPLTGLANRTRFGGALDQRLDADRPSSVLIIDLDDFKMVNDTMGHAVGDRLLIEVAQRLRVYTAAGQLPARLGADEFAVLLDDADAVHAEQAAARILAGLGEPFRVGEHELLAHASIGIAVATDGDTADEMLRNADIAMYAAKSAGKASWARFEPQMRQEAVNHARLGSELHNAIGRHELFLAYQPVFDILTGSLSSVEALVRWAHPDRGLVSPADFIPVAERSGLIVGLGAWVLREACEQLARWQAVYGPGALAGINVNVAARQLRDPRFVDDVAAVLADTGLCPRQLVLEVTESSVLDGRQVRETLQALHELGVRLALDDFGTGSSSLSLLRAFPVDVLKLDKSFVDGICHGADRGRLAVASAVAQLAETLGLGAVAEGIETQEQMVRLRELGYRYGQGFHLARPLPADAVALIIARTDRPVSA